jgi:hypothetical protein
VDSGIVWVLLVFYKSGLPTEEVLALVKRRTDSYRHVKGLIQKLWIHDESSGHVGGIYIFDSKSSLEAFQNSSLAKGIGKAYRVEGTPTRRVLRVTNVLFQGKKRLM